MIVSLGLGAISLDKLGALLRIRIPQEIRHATPKRLVTDSREVCQGDLFVALKGKKDGHAYAEEAAKRGALSLLVEKRTPACAPHLIVPDVRSALGAWAKGVTEGEPLLRIGITGSVGKTTVKDAVTAMLGTRFAVHASFGNYNNDLGLPFTLLSTPKNTEVLVCEIGVSHPGEMRALSQILAPHISLITCIGHAHIGAFGTRECIAKEKAQLLSYAEEDGHLLFPKNEPLLGFVPPHGIHRHPILPFSEEELQQYALSVSAADIPRRSALAYATAVARLCGLNEDEIKEGLCRILALEMHRKEEVVGDILFIDDTYNASPEAMLGALTYLASKKACRHVAVLGDMLELGEDSYRYHRAAGRYASECADILFFFGKHKEAYAEGAEASGAKNAKSGAQGLPAYFVLDGEKEEIATEIVRHLSARDAILFKAAHAVAADQIVALCKKKIHQTEGDRNAFK